MLSSTECVMRAMVAPFSSSIPSWKSLPSLPHTIGVRRKDVNVL
jgi:hypothetical protein